MTVVAPYPDDPVNPGILPTAGSEVIYRQASGLEKALADVDSQRLLAIYAELVSDQWDPYRISFANLPFLAHSMGVNLWEDDWSEEKRRWWTATQWTFKYQRGSLLGIKTAINAVGYRVKRAIVPPATFYPGKSLTPAERAAFVARFPQLRLYPFKPLDPHPYLCFVGKDKLGHHPKNGGFLGPLRKFYLTKPEPLSKTMRYVTLWDRGVETELTSRHVVMRSAGGYVTTTFQEVVIPGHTGTIYYAGQPRKYLLPRSHSAAVSKFGIYLGVRGNSAASLIRVPTNGALQLSQAKAIYQTIVPDLQPINLYPEYVADTYTESKYKLFAGSRKVKSYLGPGRYLIPSNAWRHLYQRWYLWDQTRYPDNRRASVYMGNARFGIPKYTAEVKVEAYEYIPKAYFRVGGFLRGYLRPRSTKVIDKVRRATVAAMALRDTVRIDTKAVRTLQAADAPLADGSFYVGQLIQS
jgi:phage tail P2-like protein